VFGIRANSETARGFTRQEKATPARTSSATRSSGSVRAGATDRATNSRPMRAPATAAVAPKNGPKSAVDMGGNVLHTPPTAAVPLPPARSGPIGSGVSNA